MIYKSLIFITLSNKAILLAEATFFWVLYSVTEKK